jgi:hypothetical protein
MDRTHQILEVHSVEALISTGHDWTTDSTLTMKQSRRMHRTEYIIQFGGHV